MILPSFGSIFIHRKKTKALKSTMILIIKYSFCMVSKRVTVNWINTLDSSEAWMCYKLTTKRYTSPNKHNRGNINNSLDSFRLKFINEYYM